MSVSRFYIYFNT